MALTPTIQWSYISTNASSDAPASGALFDPSNGLGSWGSPPALPTLSHGDRNWLLVAAAVTGTWSTTLTGNFTQGSTTITGISDTSEIQVGHQLTPDGLYLPLGPVAVVTAVTSDTITFADLSSPAGTYLAALESGTFVSFAVRSAWPLGQLSFTLDPIGGATMTDSDWDGGANGGDGSAVSNVAGQAEGAVMLALVGPGSVGLSVASVSADMAYGGAEVSAPLSFTVK